MTQPKNPAPIRFRYLLMAVGVLVVLCVVFLMWAMTTTTGSQFVLQKIAQEAGVSFKYSKGTLWQGISIQDLVIGENSDVSVYVNHATVKIGYRALLSRQVHIAQADIDTVRVVNKNAPTGEPFDYPSIKLPVTLILQKTNIKALSLEQKTKSPIRLTDIYADKALWQDTKISLDNGQIDVDKTVSVKGITGDIRLDGHYPLDLSAKVVVNPLTKAYFSPFEVVVTGSLKRTTGTIDTLYNNKKLAGKFVVQGVDDNAPFWADLAYDSLDVPYAQDQKITLTNGKLSASGVISAIDVRLNTDLTAKDIPTGRYKGRAVVNASGMSIDRLALSNTQGDLVAFGKMSWADDFWLSAKAQSDNYQARTLIPDKYSQHQNYLPKTLNGTLGVDLFTNKDGHTLYNVKLSQKNGEHIHARIRQKNLLHTDDKLKNTNPYLIDASWQNYRRDDLPNIGKMTSPSGNVSAVVADTFTDINAQASIDTLLGLPKGNYATQARLVGDDIIIKNANYVGDLGDLSVSGKVYLANDSRAMSYNLRGDIGKLMPNAYLDKPVPIKSLGGQFIVTGRTRRKEDSDIHEISFNDTTLNALLDDNKTLGLDGTGDVVVEIKNSTIANIKASYNGNISSKGLHKALDNNAVRLDVSGTTDNLRIHRLSLDGKIGQITATGNLNAKDGIGWDIRADTQSLNLAMMSDKMQQVELSGIITSRGSYKNGQLNATADVGSKLNSQFGDNDDLTASIAVFGDKYTINDLSYQGVAGKAVVSGFVDTSKGVSADISANLQNFNAGVFVKDRPSNLTGDIGAYINWQDSEQIIDIKTLDIKGTMNDEPVFAQGKAYVVLNMPKDFQAYLGNLRRQGRGRFELDKMLDLADKGDFSNSLSTLQANLGQLQTQVKNQDTQIRSVIKSLSVDNLALRFGDNYLTANGNEQNLAVDMNIQTLSQIFPTIRGQIVGGVVVTSQKHALPTIYADLMIENVSMPKFAVAKMSILGKLVNLGNEPSSLVLTGVNVVVANQTLNSVRLDMQGTQGNHDVRVFANNGQLQVNGRVQGGFDGNRYQGVLSESRLQTRFGVLNQKQPSEFVYVAKDKHLTVAPHCWKTINASTNKVGENGSVCLTDNLKIGQNSGFVGITINNLNTSVFTPFMPSDLMWESKLSGDILVDWAYGDKPDINVLLYSQDGTIGLNNEHNTNKTTVPYRLVSLIAKSEANGLRLKTEVDLGKVSGGGYADVVINPFADNKTIAGALAMDNLNLAVLRPFFPAMQSLDGKLNIAGGVGGTLQKPLFFGNATLKDGRIAAVDVPIAFDNLNMDAQIRGTQATMAGTFQSGTGTGELNADIDWQRTPTAKLSVKGDKLVVSSPPLLSATISPHLEIIARPSQKFVDIKGVVSLPYAVIRPPQATSNVVAQSPDVTVIDRRLRGNVAQILSQVEPWSINADIGVDLGDDVRFKGFGANLPLSGAIHLTQSGQGTLMGRGMVFVNERSKVDFVGQNLELNYAQIRFTGDNIKNPSLSIEGVREIEGKTVGVRVTGTVATPIITTFNDAGLSEQQAMNALVKGSLTENNAQVSEADFKNQVNNTLAAAGLSLGLKGTHGITNQIGQALGFQSLTLDASGGSADTNVNVTGYISPDLYIRYGVGVFNAQSSLSVRYQLTRRVYVEATSAVDKFVDVVYRWRF